MASRSLSFNLLLKPVGLGSLLLISALTTAGPVEQVRAADVARLFSSYGQPTVPGCAVGVYENGRKVLSRGFGAADVDSKRLIDEIALGQIFPMRYAGGLMVGYGRGQDWVWHSGGVRTFRAEYIRLPKLKVSAAVLCNRGGKPRTT